MLSFKGGNELETNNFVFLADKFPKLANICEEIENIFYQDPQAVLMKGRVFSEELLEEISNQHDDINSIKHLRLVDRIQYLEKEEVLTKDIARSFDAIRHLGNKASHAYIEYDLEKAFKMHRKLFDVSVWFMEVYGDYSFRAPKYKIPQPHAKTNDDIVHKLEERLTSSLEEKFSSWFEAQKATAAAVEVPEKVDGNEEKIEMDQKTSNVEAENESNTLDFDFTLEEGESYLLTQLSKLQESSQEAIENSNQFSTFKEYLHVKRSIEDDLEKVLRSSTETSQSKLIFLCGSVGDGKSHLLAYIKHKHPELLSQFIIHNDATESFDPEKNSLDTLAEVLKPFNDENIDGSQENLILAINLGVLHNFIESKYAKENFNKLSQFIHDCKVFEDSTLTENRNHDYFELISFSDYQPFELTEKGPVSSYYSTLLERIVNNSDDNPFYQAYKKDKQNKISGFFIDNYELLMSSKVRERIVSLLIEVIIKQKIIISTRALLNFVHDILVPADKNTDYFNADTLEKTERLLPNLIFDGKDRSTLLAAITQLDPIHRRLNTFDQILIELNNSMNIKETFNEYLDLTEVAAWNEEASALGAFQELSNASAQLLNRTLIRFLLFVPKNQELTPEDSNYTSYLVFLYYSNKGNRSGLRELYDLLKDSIFLWNGKPKDGYVYIDKANQNIQIAQKLKIHPHFKHLKVNNEEVLNRFYLTMLLAYSDQNKENPIFIEIDYPLYQIMVNLSKGYRPNKKDKEDCIQFVEFIEKVMQHGERKNELMFVSAQEGLQFKLSYDEDYEEFTFRRE